MAETTGMTKLAGRLGTLTGLVGILLFFLGLFIMPRMYVFVGVGLIAVSLAAYYIEELGHRRRDA